MKELSLYEIRDKALESGRSVYSSQQLANLISKPKAIATVYALRLVKKGLAQKLSKGKICFENDDFIIASQFIEPSYISLHSALLFHGLINQVPKNIECITLKNSFQFKKLGITYHKIPAQLFYGFEKYPKGKSYIMMAKPEKAILDGLYLNIFTKKDLQELTPKIDIKKLTDFIKKYKGHSRKKLEKLIEHD